MLAVRIISIMALKINLVLLAFFLVLLLPSSWALGVAMPYMEAKTLPLLKNHYTSIEVFLQNGEDADVEVSFTVDGKLAQVINPKQSYTLPAKSYETKVVINITDIPSSKVGDVFPITYSLAPLEAAEGDIPMKVKIENKFFVKIVDELPKKWEWDDPEVQMAKTGFSKGTFIGIGMLILVTAMVVLLWKKSKSLVRKR